jgi:uncharacterized membrane protein YbhN (UPF0104 family)
VTPGKNQTLKITALLAVICVGIFYFISNYDEIKKIFAVNAVSLILLSFLVLSTQALNGCRLKVLTDSLNMGLKPITCMGMAVVQSFMNYLPFKGGMLANAVYLKKIHQLSYAHFISIMASSVLVSFVTIGIIGLVISALIAGNQGTNWVLPGLFLILIVLPLLLLSMAARVESCDGLWGRLNGVLEGWRAIRGQKGILMAIVVMDICSALIFSIRYYIAFRAFSLNMPFVYCLIISPLSILATFASVTPAGLGIREVVVGYSSRALGIGLNHGIFAASLDRAVVMIWVFILGPVFSHILLMKKKS